MVFPPLKAYIIVYLRQHHVKRCRKHLFCQVHQGYLQQGNITRDSVDNKWLKLQDVYFSSMNIPSETVNQVESISTFSAFTLDTLYTELILMKHSRNIPCIGDGKFVINFKEAYPKSITNVVLLHFYFCIIYYYHHHLSNRAIIASAITDAKTGKG